MGFYLPILGPYAVSLGAPMTMVGVLIGSYGLSQLLLRVPIGALSDRMGRRKPFVVAGIACAVLSCIGLALARDPLFLVLSRAVGGVGASFYVAVTVLFASYFTRKGAYRAMGLIQFASSASVIVASLLGGYIAGAFGWLAAFYVGAAVGSVGILVALGIQERRPQETFRPATLLKVSNLGPLMTVSVIAAFTQYANWATTFGFSPIKAVELGASKPVLGILTTVAGCANLVGLLVSSSLAQRIGPRNTVVLGLLLMAGSVAWVPFVGALPLLGASQALTGLGGGLAFPVLMGLSIRDVPPQERATAMGIYQATYALGMFLGPMLAGKMADSLGLDSVFLFTASVVGLGAMLAFARVRARAAPTATLA